MFATPRLVGCGISTALILTMALAAQSTSGNLQSVPPGANPCGMIDANMPHFDALSNVCQYAVTVPQRMPNFTCR